ncbi:hypothetical protein CHH83_06835 [Bacillus sp. 7586-K]|nr:hypothetical protein CHH83_06835 [Bacillus sp. 7586-K]
MTNGWMSGFNRICEWIARLAYVNVLWLCFTILGLFICGIGPATVSLFSIIRKWLQKEADFPIFKTFWLSFKKEFVKANLLFFSLLFITIILYVDWVLIQSMTGILHYLFLMVFAIVAFLFSVIVLYIFPVYVQFEGDIFHYYKSAILVGISHPIRTCMIGLAGITNILICLILPGAAIVFGCSGLSYFVMYISYSIFSQVSDNAKFKNEGKAIEG